jgi:hypothetical protein
VKYCTLGARIAVLCLSYVNPLEESPLHATDNSTFTSSIFLRILCTFYFLLPPVLFTLTQVVLLLNNSTFTRVQIQSNFGATGDARQLSKKISSVVKRELI